jgi:dihydrofolate reductase
MRKLVVSNVMSLDGYVDRGRPGEPGLPIVTEADAAAFNRTNAELLRDADVLLVGRNSFAMFEGYWPTVEQDETAPEVEREISRHNNRVAKVVVSDSHRVQPDAPWAAATRVVTRQEAPAAIRELKQQDGGDVIVFGSVTTWNGLLRAGVVDEVRLLVTPVVLGGGVPAFAEDLEVGLELKSATPVPDSGSVLLRYVVAEPRR